MLGFSAGETAEALATTTASVNSALQRAHKVVDERLPARSQQVTLRLLGDAGLRRVVDGYVDAWERGDVDAVVSMLTDDATITMPPIPWWYAGRDVVREFLRARPFAGGQHWRVVSTHANGQPAFGHYLRRDGEAAFAAHSISILTLEGDRISEINAFLDEDLPRRLGLPAVLR